MEKWKGKIAVVTGASSGIGAAITEELVKLGMARRKELMDALAQKVKPFSGNLYPLKVDVTKESELLQAFAWIKTNLGPVSILVNNSGILIYDMLIDGKTDNWSKYIDTNVLGLCIATREAVKDMRDNEEDGHIIHIGGISGHFIPKFTGYSINYATKSAIVALTETLRQELNSIGSRIKISNINPGAVDTDMMKDTVFLQNNVLETGIPMLQVKDIVDAVIYILSTPPHVQVHDLIIRPVGESF